MHKAAHQPQPCRQQSPKPLRPQWQKALPSLPAALPPGRKRTQSRRRRSAALAPNRAKWRRS